MQKITPFLWFDGQAEEAVAFYLSVFKDGKIHSTTRYPENGPRPAGTVMTIAFELQGEQFVALNGGPGFPFTNAVSLVVNCESQEEIDHYWEKLAADGGERIQCGWLKDKFGCRGRSCRAKCGSGCGAKIPRACSGSRPRSGRWRSWTSPSWNARRASNS